MKKIVSIVLLLISLCGCKKVEEIVDYNYSDMGIVSPTGAPSLVFINCLDDPTFETNTNPKNIISMMNSNSDKRIVVMDTIAGLKAIRNGAPYKLAFNITFGNFYLAATGNDDDYTLNSNDNIVVFGDTGAFLFKYLYGENFNSIEMVASVSDAAKCLATGKNLETDTVVDYVLVAEPVLTTTLNNQDLPTYGKSYIYSNIQELYKEKTSSSYVQASVFIKDDGYIQDFNDYANYFETNVDLLLSNQEYVEEILKVNDDEETKNIFGIGSNMIKQVLKTNSVNIGFKKAIDNKEAIDYLLNLQGIEITNEEEYFK